MERVGSRRWRGWLLVLSVAVACGGRQRRSDEEGAAGGASALAGRGPGHAGVSAGGASSHGGEPASAGRATNQGGATIGGATAVGGVTALGGVAAIGGVTASGGGGLAGGGFGGLPPIQPPCRYEGAPPCAPGTVCSRNLAGGYQCMPCGGQDQLCCDGDVCNGSGCCVEGHCAANGSSCRQHGDCHSGQCTGCGAEGEPCCASKKESGPLSCAASDLHCEWTVGACFACGKPGQACCSGNTCAGDACCTTDDDPRSPSLCVAAGDVCSNGSICKGQACGDCGKPGQPCCSPSGSPHLFCSADYTQCSSVDGEDFACEACGGPGQRWCETDQFCKSGQEPGPNFACP